MNELYIYHHLGLGDHIICNAIIRNYASKYDRIILFVKPHNLTSVSFMYRDLENIIFIVADDFYAENYIKENSIKNLLKIGFNDLDTSIPFDQSFYNCAGIEFEKRWTDFYYKRDEENELKIWNSIQKIFDWDFDNEKYMFKHEDVERGFPLNVDYSMNTVFPIKGLTDNIFDYTKIIENASEIHCIDSSFKLLSDSIELQTENITFYHNRRQSINLYSTSKKNWKIK